MARGDEEGGRVSFLLSGKALRTFRAAILALQRVSTDLVLDATPAVVHLRAINTSKTAYLSVTFLAACFESLHVTQAEVWGGLPMKAVLAALRSHKMETLRFSADTRLGQASFEVTVPSGLVKTYRVAVTEVENLRGTADTSRMATKLAADPADLNKLLSTFSQAVTEVTLAVEPRVDDAMGGITVELGSYHDSQAARRPEADEVLRTRMNVQASHAFQNYDHRPGAKSRGTFKLRDFRAGVALCEALRRHVLVFLDKPSAPLVIQPYRPGPDGPEEGADELVRAELMLATFVEDDGGEADAEGAQGAGPASAAAGDEVAGNEAGGSAWDGARGSHPLPRTAPTASTPSPPAHARGWGTGSGGAGWSQEQRGVAGVVRGMEGVRVGDARGGSGGSGIGSGFAVVPGGGTPAWARSGGRSGAGVASGRFEREGGVGGSDGAGTGVGTGAGTGAWRSPETGHAARGSGMTAPSTPGKRLSQLLAERILDDDEADEPPPPAAFDLPSRADAAGTAAGARESPAAFAAQARYAAAPAPAERAWAGAVGVEVDEKGVDGDYAQVRAQMAARVAAMPARRGWRRNVRRLLTDDDDSEDDEDGAALPGTPPEEETRAGHTTQFA